MAVHISDLPIEYQQQAFKKLQAQQTAKAPAALDMPKVSKRKYHNQPTPRTGEGGIVLHFDSKKEARRYDELLLLQQAGEIADLRLQVDFTLQEAYTDSSGQRIRAIRYKADFTYRKNGALIVEDVKSKATKTKVYVMKKKLMKERLGIDIQEI